MNETKINEIIDYIKDDTALSAIFSERVTYHSFVNEPTSINLIVRDLNDNRNLATGEALIEFRIVAPEKTIGPMDIRNHLNLIRDTFAKNALTIGETRYYQIEALNDIFVAQNPKAQYEGITTLIFKE